MPQLPVENWHEWTADPALADAILDRIIHNAYPIHLKGESQRKTRGLATKCDSNDINSKRWDNPARKKRLIALCRKRDRFHRNMQICRVIINGGKSLMSRMVRREGAHQDLCMLETVLDTPMEVQIK